MKPVLSAVKTQKLIVDRTKNATNQFQVVTSDEQRGGSMERRYLAAALALAATFAIFSGEFCVRNLHKVPHSKTQLKADIACARSYVAKQLMAKLEPYVGSHASEARPMLAELVVPELPPSPAAPMAPPMSARQKCEAAAPPPRAPPPLIAVRPVEQ